MLGVDRRELAESSQDLLIPCPSIEIMTSTPMIGWLFTWLLGIELGSLGFHVASTSRLSCFPSTLCVRAPVDTCVDAMHLGGTSVWDTEFDGCFL